MIQHHRFQDILEAEEARPAPGLVVCPVAIQHLVQAGQQAGASAVYQLAWEQTQASLRSCAKRLQLFACCN